MTLHTYEVERVRSQTRVLRRSLRLDGEPGNLTDTLTALNHQAGNRAVASLLGGATHIPSVQRKEGPQSTDAPGRSPKKDRPPEDYAPTEANPKFASWSNQELAGHASDALGSSVKNGWAFAAEAYEELWFRTKDNSIGLNIYRAYKKLDDGKRAQFWLGVSNGSIKPGRHSADDQTGKEF